MSTINFQDILDTMPKSCIPEIQELIQGIHTKIKMGSIPPNGNFFVFYRSYLSSLSGEIKNKLSMGYKEIFEKAIAVSMCNLQQHNPYEHPNTGIEREMERVELGWKAVQAKKEYLQNGLNGYKKMLDPIIEIYLKGDDKETSKYIRDNINLTSTDKYGDYDSARRNAGSLTTASNQFEQGAYNLLHEMCIYEEKGLLQDLITTMVKVYHICRKCHKWIIVHGRVRNTPVDFKRYIYPILFSIIFDYIRDPRLFINVNPKDVRHEIKTIYPDIYLLCSNISI
jgi:hypothetical protein